MAGYARPTLTGSEPPGRASLDDLVGKREQRLGKSEAERVRGFEVNHKFELGCLIDRDITWLNATKDLVHIVGNLPGSFGAVGSIGQQPTKIGVEAARINSGQPLSCRKLNNSSAKPVGNDDRIRRLLDESS